VSRNAITDASPTRSLGARDGALERGLAHLRPALDVQPPRLGLQLLARRRVSAADGARLLAQRCAGARRQVLQRLLAASTGLRLLDVALGRLAYREGDDVAAQARDRFGRPVDRGTVSR
jgi:hypothetical protein